MIHTALPPPPPGKDRRFSLGQVLAIMTIVIILTAFATVFIIRYYLFPPPFKPVVLTTSEQQQLEQKLDTLQLDLPIKTHFPSTSTEQESTILQPEPYNEEDLSREIRFSERELNALIAHNTDLATKLAIDLSEDLISLKLLIPMDPDFPMLGGKTLRVKTGAELGYAQGRPVVRLKGVSIMGVPMPNSWLGGIKNIDLVREFGETEGFWKSFADGIESIRITDGFLAIRLKS